MLEIKLKNGAANAHQRFSDQLGDNLIDFEIDYVSYLDSPAWSANIYRDGTRLVAGAMLEPGADIIGPNQLGIGRLVFVGEEVTLTNLGTENQLVWVEDVT
jgi:hypothetical protein